MLAKTGQKLNANIEILKKMLNFELIF